MNFKQTQNNRAVKLKEIPEMELDALKRSIIKECLAGRRLICFFAEKAGEKLYAALADDVDSAIYLASSPLKGVRSYGSLTPELPQAHMFERELWEETGIVPEGHPWLKPVRYGHNRADKKQVMENYPFFKMEGEEIHEVGVGPVHAGVIEPGHFRFMCEGEEVHHLEIQLGYQHRGVEGLFVKNNGKFMPHLAESIAGDTVIGHVSAYCGVIEGLCGCEAPKRAYAVRAAALELERASMHAGGLSAIAGDIAYLMGNAVFGANRTVLINTSLLICGSRTGRGLVRPGGVLFDIDDAAAAQVKKNAAEAYENIRAMAEEMFSSASVLSRLQQTGVIDRETAVKAGLTGFAARASGVALDSRADHPSGAYNYFPVAKMTMETGDVFARAYLRYMEIGQSVKFISDIMDNLPSGPVMRDPGSPGADSLAISIAEGWRGAIVHAAITGPDKGIIRYKVKDPSFNNWYGLALSVRGNGISDFPLINKSFDLSYCGNDL